MSASSKKKLRAEDNAARLTERQLAQAKEDKKVRLYTAAFAVVMALIVVVALVAGVNQAITSRGIRERKTTALTLNEHTLSNAELNYFFVDAVNNFYSQNGSYAAMFGLDLTKPLDQQVMSEESGETWADYFLETAEENARAAYAMADEAEAAGFTLSAEDQESIDTIPYNLETYAKLYGLSDAKAYVKAMYGRGATVESFQEYVRMNTLASEYQTSYKDSLTYDDNTINAKDAEDPNAYSSYSYSQYYLSTSRYLTDDATAEEKAAAAEADAKALTADTITTTEELDAAIAALEVNKELTSSASSFYANQRYVSVNSNLIDWISDASRKEGDRTYIANTSTTTDDNGQEVTTVSGYYVVYFHKALDNRFPLVNVRHILVAFEGTTDENGSTVYTDEAKAAAKSTAQDLLAQWKAGDATEESFAALATENSADTGSVSNGGLYEDVYPGQMVTAFNDWCFAEGRKAGDTNIIETEYGYHVMYFSGNTDYTYREYLITNDLADDDFTVWYTNLVDAVTMTEGNTKYVSTDLVLQNS